MSSSGFAALCSAFGRYDVVHIHAEGPAFFAWLPKLLGSSQGRAKKVVQTAQREQSEHLQRQNLLQKVRRKIGLSLAK